MCRLSERLWSVSLTGQVAEPRDLHLPLDRLEHAGTGDLTARVTWDVTVAAYAVRTALPQLTRAALTIVLTLAGMAVLDWRFLLAALLDLYEATLEPRWYHEAVGVAEALLARFADPDHGGFFTTSPEHEELPARRKDLEDSPVPSGNSAAALALLRLALDQRTPAPGPGEAAATEARGLEAPDAAPEHGDPGEGSA